MRDLGGGATPEIRENYSGGRKEPTHFTRGRDVTRPQSRSAQTAAAKAALTVLLSRGEAAWQGRQAEGSGWQAGSNHTTFALAVLAVVLLLRLQPAGRNSTRRA